MQRGPLTRRLCQPLVHRHCKNLPKGPVVLRSSHFSSGHRTSYSFSATKSWWLQPDPTRVQAIEQAVSAYTTSPSSARAEVAKAEMDRDMHIFYLNERMTEMFERIQSTSMPPEVVAEHKRLAFLTSVVAFSHQRMETQDYLMENMQKTFRMSPHEGESVKFKVDWSLARNKMPGLNRQEHSAVIEANETRIFRASELESSVSTQATAALQQHLGASHIRSTDFLWFLCFLATHPSDDAFDVVSAALLKRAS